MKMARDCGNCFYEKCQWEEGSVCYECESTFEVGSVPSRWDKAAHIKFKIVDDDDRASSALEIIGWLDARIGRTVIVCGPGSVHVTLVDKKYEVRGETAWDALRKAAESYPAE